MPDIGRGNYLEDGLRMLFACVRHRMSCQDAEWADVCCCWCWRRRWCGCLISVNSEQWVWWLIQCRSIVSAWSSVRRCTACSAWRSVAVLLSISWLTYSSDMVFVYRILNGDVSDNCWRLGRRTGQQAWSGARTSNTPFTRYNQPAVSCKQTSNRLSILGLFVQPVVKPGCTTALTTGCIHDTAVCQNRLSNGFDNRFDNRLYRVNGA